MASKETLTRKDDLIIWKKHDIKMNEKLKVYTTYEQIPCTFHNRPKRPLATAAQRHRR